MTSPLVEARGVHKNFGATHVLRGVDFEVAPGEVTCIVGPSGSGKSTFLRCINHLETIDKGRLKVDGSYVGYEERDGKLYELGEKQLAARRAGIGMVFQRFNLFPHLSVLQNIIEAPILLKKTPRAQAVDEAMALLSQVGLTEKREFYPSQLSGGQQQRVAIARALAMKPKLMLFDEPTSALDPELVGEVLAVMRALAIEGRTMIVVTHEMGFAQEVANSLVLMDEGRIVERGIPADMIANPQHQRTAAFMRNVRGKGA